MKYNTLGDTSITVSEICLGTMTFGEQNSKAEGHAQMDFAVERGLNFFDTAEMYAVPARPETQGETERIIGEWFKESGKRGKVVLASKITGPSRGLSHIRNPLDFSPEQIRAAIEGSLQRLQTDYIDLYQLHWPERKSNFFSTLGYVHQPDDPWEDNFLEILHSMQALVDEGKIRHFGISNETPWGMCRFLHLAERHGLPRCVSIQNPYNLLNRSFEVGAAEIAIREKMGLLAYSPMAFGVLSGKYLLGKDHPEDRINQFPQYKRYSSPNSQTATRRYLDIARKAGLSLAQLSLAFVNSRPFVTSTIIGATNLTQLEENIGSAEIQLSQETLEQIEAVHREISNPAP